MAKCYKIEYTDKEGKIKSLGEFDTKDEAEQYLKSVTYDNNVYNTVEQITSKDNYNLPAYFTTNNLLNPSTLEEFFMYDNMYSMGMNGLLYGSSMIGHKNAVEVVKRNGNLPSNGTSLGLGEVDNVGIIKSTVINGVDVQDAQTSTSPIWYFNRYIKSQGKAGKYNKQIEKVFYEKIIPGFPLSQDELKLLTNFKSKLTPRKLVLRDHFNLGKTSFNILSREAVSIILNDNPQTRERLVQLYRQITDETLSQEQYRNIVREIHSNYIPLKGREYHHNMLNDLELKKTAYIMVDSASKLIKPNVGQYVNGVFQYQQSTVSTEFIREQVSTDSTHKVKTDSVHGSQQQGLVWSEQNLSASLDYNISGKKGKVNIGNLINHYFNLKATRLEFAGNKLINQFLDKFGNVKRDTIVELLNSKSFKVKSENTVKELLELNVSTSNAFVSKDSEAAIVTETSKSLKQRVAGNSYTLASSYGYNVVVDSFDNVVPSEQVKRNPRLYEKFDTRRLNFGKYDDNKNIYYAEVIVSQDFLDRMGIDDVANINNELLLGLGVRIPTEGKNSMVVLKVVDVLPRIYTGVILAPDEVINYSGADFDIDKMFVRHFDVYTDSNNNKQKYGSYLKYNTKENRLRAAYEEYLNENEEITLDRFSKKYGKTIEDNYNAKSFVEITPITKAEANNLLLDIEVLLAFNQYNREQAEYPNSLQLWKEVIIKDYLIKNGLDDKSGKLVTGISSAVDKLIAQDSIDVGGNNIGVAATFNIMYALLNHYGIRYDAMYLFDRAINFSDTTNIDVHTNKLDSEGLTKNGLIRKTAVIATLINMMTDNAKEQLAKELNLTRDNLSGFLIGVGVGLDLRALTLVYNKETNAKLDKYSYKDDRVFEIIDHVIKFKDYGLEALNSNLMFSYQNDSKLQNRVKGIIDFLSSYTSEDIGDNLPSILNDGEYSYNISKEDYFTTNKLLFKDYIQNTTSLQKDLINLNTVRSLIKGASKSEFVAFDKVYRSLDELGVSYKTTETKLTKDLDKRLIIEQGVGYYRPVLGEQEVIKYTFKHEEGIGRVIVENQEIFSLLLNTVVVDNHVAKYAHLKRSSIVRHFFQYSRRLFPLRRYNKSLDSKGLSQLQDAYLNYLNVRTFGNKLSQYYQKNPENSYYHALFKPSMFYVEEGNTHFVELLRARLLKSEAFTDNLFLQQLGVKYIKSNTRTGQQLVSLEINTVNESKTEFKDGITNDLRLLDTKVNIIEAYNTLTTQGLDALTDKQVAQLIFVTVEAYSFVTTGHSFRPNSVSMFLPSPYLNKLYGKLNLVEALFNKYNDVPMNKANTKKFNEEFKEITGTYFDRMLLEFYQFEGINNGFAYDVREASQGTIAKIIQEAFLKTPYKYGYQTNSPLQRTLNINGKTIVHNSSIIIDFKDIINESSDGVIDLVSLYMNLFNNHRFLQYTRVDDIKPAVFPPVIQHEGNNVLSYVITIEGSKDKPIYTEYYYDYKNTGKVYQQRINLTEKGREVIGTLQESRYMPLSGFVARYSKMDKYADSQLSNILPLEMYRNDAINIEQAFAESKEIIDGRTPSVIEDSGVNETELEQAKDKEKEIIKTLPPVVEEEVDDILVDTQPTPTNATQIYSQLGSKTKTPNIEIDNVAGRKASTRRGIVAYRTRGNNFLEAFEKDRTIGNPWNSKGYALYKPNSVKESVIEFIKWLTGEAHTDKLQDYRQAIIDNLDNLRGRKIIYYEELNEPSHATALDYLINKYDWNTQTTEVEPTTPTVEQQPDVETEITELNVVDRLKQFTNKYSLPFNWQRFQTNIYTPLEIFNRFFQEGLQFAQTEEEQTQINPNYYGLEGKGLSITVQKESKNRWYLSSFYLPEFMQNKGMGRDIIDILKYIAATSKSDKTIYIWSEKEAVGFWNKQGFKKTGEQITDSDQHLSDPTLPPFEVMDIFIKGNQPKITSSSQLVEDETAETTQQTAPNIRFMQNELDEDLDEINMSLLQPIEFINTILNKYQVNGVIPKSKTLDVYNEVEKYNNRLGYQAINIYDNQGYIALDTNIDGQLNAKSTTETIINILNKLSNKFNIPYELDTTLPYKGIFTKGKVIVNPNLLTDDTPFHEFAHPFVAAIKRMNRPLYNQLIKEIKQEKTILDRTDKLYRQFLMNKGLSGTQLESSILEEAIVTAVGEYATDYNKLHSKSSTLLDSIREFLNFIKQSIMDMFNKNSVNIENIPNDITLRELAIILASDIKVTNQTKLNKEVLNILNQIDICS